MHIDAGRRLDSLGAVLHSNRAMVLGQEGEGARGEALRAALASISADPSYAKGHHRVGSALQARPPSLPPAVPPSRPPSLPTSPPWLSIWGEMENRALDGEMRRCSPLSFPRAGSGA